jgi:hypothetical protein
MPALGRLLGIEIDHQNFQVLRGGYRQMQRKRRFSASTLLANDTPHFHTNYPSLSHSDAAAYAST